MASLISTDMNGQTLRDGEGWRGLACYSPRGGQESDGLGD